jgi:hypothetical protein
MNHSVHSASPPQLLFTSVSDSESSASSTSTAHASSSGSMMLSITSIALFGIAQSSGITHPSCSARAVELPKPSPPSMNHSVHSTSPPQVLFAAVSRRINSS